MKTTVLFLTAVLLLTACSGSSPKKRASVTGTWIYNHERTKEEVAKLFEGRRITERQLDRTVVHFKKHPPKLVLRNDGTYEMHRLQRTTGFFSGEFVRKGDSLYLNNREGNKMWNLGYDKEKDEYELIFVLYPIVLSREQ